MNENLDKKDAEAIAMSINLLFGNAKMFSPSHPSTEKAAEELCRKVMAAVGKNPRITFIKSGKSFYIEKWIVDSRINHSRFTQDFEKLQLESISFTNRVSTKSTMTFLNTYVFALENKMTADKIQDILTAKNISGVMLNYITLQKVAKDDKVVGADEIVIKESFAPPSKMPKETASHLDKLFNIKNAIEGNFSQISSNFDVANGLNIIKHQIKSEERSGVIDYDALFSSLSDISKVVKSTEFLFNDKKNNEAKVLASQIDQMTMDAILEIIKKEIKEQNFSVKKLILLVKRLDPSREDLQILLPQIKNAMLEAGLSVSDYLNFVMDLGNKTSEEKAMEKIFDKADAYGVKPSEIVEAFSHNPQECVKLLLQSAEIQKQQISEINLSDYLSKMLDDISRDAALQKIKTQKIDGDVHSAISQVISTINEGLLSKLKENGLENESINEIQKELSEKFPKTLEHLKNEWLVNTLGTAENLSQDAIVKTLTKVIDTSSADKGIYKKSLLRFSEKFNLSPDEITQILGGVRRMKKLHELQKDLPLMPPETTAYFIKRCIEEYKRHKNPFSVIIISSKSANDTEARFTTSERFAFLLAENFRFLDISGSLKIRGKDIAVIILPMTGSEGLEVFSKKIDNLIDPELNIFTSVSYEQPAECENYEAVLKKLLRKHF